MVDTYSLPSVPFAAFLQLPLDVRVEGLPGVYARARLKTDSRVFIECDATPGATLLIMRHPDAVETFSVTRGSMKCLVTDILYSKGQSVTVPVNTLHGFKVGDKGANFTSEVKRVKKW